MPRGRPHPIIRAMQAKYDVEELQEMFTKRTHDRIFEDVSDEVKGKPHISNRAPEHAHAWRGYEILTNSRFLYAQEEDDDQRCRLIRP